MEQIRKRDASPPSESSTITREKFIQEKTVDKNDRYALAFFILNTLNFIQNGDGWYCYCDQMVKEKAVLKASLVRNQVIAKFAKCLTYLTVLSNLLINTVLICRYYVIFMTSFPRILLSSLINAQRLLNAFWGRICVRWSRLEHWRILECFPFRKYSVR